MPKKSLIFFTLLIFISIPSVFTGISAADSAPTAISFEVISKDYQNNVIPGVTVEVTGAGGGPYRVITDSNGKGKLSNVPAGSRFIRWSKPGAGNITSFCWTNIDKGLVSITSSLHTWSNMDVLFDSIPVDHTKSIIAGVVFDAPTGTRPAPGVTVTMIPAGGTIYYPGETPPVTGANTATQTNGGFMVIGVDNGTYTLNVSGTVAYTPVSVQVNEVGLYVVEPIRRH